MIIKALRGSQWVVWAALGLAACGGKSLQSDGAGGGVAAGGGGVVASGGGGAATDRTACVVNTDCRLLPKGCCDCGPSPLSSYVALNVAYAEAFSAEQCTSPAACGPCAPIPSRLDNPTNYCVATCEAGQCTTLDLHETPLTDCSSDSDCAPRSGTECCDACDGSVTLSLNASRASDLQTLVCGSDEGKCRDCSWPTLGVGLFPQCRDGKCQLQGGCNQCFD